MSDLYLRNKIYLPNLNLVAFIGGLAIFLSLLPWVSFQILDLDSQPWPALFFSLFLMLIPRHILGPKYIYIFLMFILIGSFISILRSHDVISFLTIRAIYNYLSFIIIFLGFYNYIKKYGFPLNLLIAVNILWLIAGVVELFYPELIALFSAQRTSENRGVTAFAPEPTFFAIYLFFSSWLILVAKDYKLNKVCFYLIFLNLLAIFALAKSAMGILYLFIACMFYLFFQFFRLKIRSKAMNRSFVFIIIFIIAAFSLYKYFEDIRFMTLLFQLITEVNPLSIFYLDASMNERLENVVFSIHGAFINYFIPAGFDTFNDFQEYLRGFYNGFFWYSAGGLKISSWIGDWVYQLGFFGIFFLIYIFHISGDKTYKRLIELSLLFVILLSAVPVAFPLVPMLFASFIYIDNKNI